MNTTVAVVAALGSALAYAVASVLQHRSARTAPAGGGLHLRLLAHLAARPVWLAGLAVAIAALALHALALSLGQLAVVQPLLVSGLLFALPVSVILDRRRPSITEWAWVVVLVAGLALFLTVAQPTVGHAPADTDRLAVLVASGVAAAVTVMLVAKTFARQHIAAVYGLAAGITYGLTAALIKEVTGIAGHHPLDLLTTWPIYALTAIGALAVVVNQAAYQAGPLAASLPAMTMLNPLVAITAGVFIFDEHLAHTPLNFTIETLSVLAVTLATAQLARRSSHFPDLDHRHSPGTHWHMLLRRGARR